ncbi:MAG: ABC transporter permease [Lachnospiraceae bacterium]|nr:ABC transporter permease [Lachnospiraceae bacterium]
MMEKLLLVRERLSGIYGRYSMLIQPLTRFVVMFGALLVMGEFIGFGGLVGSPVVFAAVSLIGAWLPFGLRLMIVAVLVLCNLYSLSLEAMAAVAAVMIVMFCVNYIFRPERNVLLLLMPVCYFLGIPYAPVLLVGLTGSLLEVIPVAFSTILYYMVVYIGNNASLLSSASSLTMLEKVMQLVSGLVNNQEMWLMCIALCAMLVITWLVGRMRHDYSRYIGMGMGMATGIMVLLVGIFALDIRLSVVLMIVGFVLSAVIAFAVEFFMLPLSYLQTEYVQFEDDDYYYYVKAVPKMAISRPEVQVKKLNIRKELENTSAIPDVSGMEATNELPDVKDR